MTFDDIVDLAVDENFEVFIDHRGDIGTVKGRAAFEQRLVIRLTERLRSLIGRHDADQETIKTLAQTYIQRIATEEEQLEDVAAYGAEFPDDRPGVLEITVIYDTGDPLEFDIES